MGRRSSSDRVRQVERGRKSWTGPGVVAMR